jgi:hypothetical protein
MKITLDIPSYSSEEGIKLKWENNFEIAVSSNANEVVLTANKEGLISLANQLLTLAQSDIPSGRHIHYDEFNSLDEGSVNFVIQKK